MDQLRSICFIYGKRDAYNTCYLKEFFKWIGFAYMDVLYNEKNNIFDTPEKCRFDIIVNVNGILPETKQQELSKTLDSRFISLDIAEGKQDFLMLQELLKKIMELFLEGESCQLLLRLSDIYEEYRMVNILYAYTFVLLEKMDKEMNEKLCVRCCGALGAVEKEIEKCEGRCGNDPGKRFLEYALFAKYDCQRKINELLLLCGDALKFDVEDYLTNINKIYELDGDFYKVEFLKARVADQDSRYNAYARIFLENCIAQCKVDACRSYHYYSIAKWRERNRQPYEAEQYYHLSWKSDPSNIKAVFKLAVENARNGKLELAEIFLWNIIDLWNDQDDKGLMPPREIEYAFKVRKWMAILKRDLSWNSKAEALLDYIHSLKEAGNVKNYCFMKRMYPDQTELEKICDAMLNRIDIRCID